MKLIIVERSRREMYERLTRQFEDDIHVAVILERRGGQRRRSPRGAGPERRWHDRRRLSKPFDGRGYIVIQIAG